MKHVNTRHEVESTVQYIETMRQRFQDNAVFNNILIAIGLKVSHIDRSIDTDERNSMKQ